MKATLSELMAFLVSGRARTNSFYPTIINALRKRETPGIGTMGVTIENEALTLLYDPQLIEDLEFEELTLIIIHEVFHLALNHIPRYLRLIANTESELQQRKVSAVANIAMDYAVNSLMVRLRECAREDIQENLGKYSGIYPTDVGLPEGKSFEWYLSHILEDVKIIRIRMNPNGCPGEGEGTGKGNGESDEESLIKDLEDYHRRGAPTSNHEQLKNAAESMTEDQVVGLADKTERNAKSSVRKAMKDCKDRGTIPGQFMEILDKFLTPPKVPWERILRTWITNTRRVKSIKSLRRPKRRILVGEEDACEFPGRITDKSYTLIFAVDTSGSMSSKDIQKCLTELQGLQKADNEVKITIIECDAHIHKEYTVGAKDEIDFKVKGRGGTTFDPVFIRAKDIRPDALIYATDGYAPLPRVENRVDCPVIWVVTPDGVYPGHGYHRQSETHQTYGKMLRINQ